MRITVLGGAGIIGRAVAQDLAESIDEILIADLDQASAEQVAGSLGPAVRSKGVDVKERDSLARALDGADACINCVQYYFNLEVMRGCLRAGVPYLDLGGLFHTTRRQLDLHDEFAAAGVTAILGLGSCPGVANVQAGHLAGMVDSVRSVRIYNGSTIDQGESLSWAYSVETILDEISQDAMVFRDGEFKAVPPLSDEEYYLFPEPIGYAKTHLSLHSEVATLPLSLADKGIEECTFKITFFGYSEAALRKMQFLAELGFARREKINVDGVQVSPRAVLMALLKDAPAARVPPKNPGFKDIVTEVEGEIDGQPVKLRMDTSAWPHARWGISGGKLLVASPPAIVARWLAERSLDEPGVWAPEQVIDPARFFAELESRGVKNTITRTSALEAGKVPSGAPD